MLKWQFRSWNLLRSWVKSTWHFLPSISLFKAKQIFIKNHLVSENVNVWISLSVNNMLFYQKIIVIIRIKYCMKTKQNCWLLVINGLNKKNILFYFQFVCKKKFFQALFALQLLSIKLLFHKSRVFRLNIRYRQEHLSWN